MAADGLRVIVVGGAGGMGRWAVRSIARLGSASALTVADLDVARAETLCAEVGAPARPLRLDVTDRAGLLDAFQDHDVVVNTMGPFATFVRPIVSAAIDAGCHYLDIDDDWQPTLTIFDLDDDARRAGLHVITGLGGSPGVTNLCAVMAAERLDVVRELYTGWKLSGARVVEEAAYPAGKASAASEHWLHQCSEPIRAWDNGGPAWLEPVTPVELDFPGIGLVSSYTMGHPEPITLPRRYPELRRSLNVQAGPTWLMELLRDTGRAYAEGRVSLQEGAEILMNPRRPDTEEPRSPLPIEWALAIGERDGASMSVAAYPLHWHPGLMGGNTGAPVAVGVELLRRGQLADVGVHAPEAAVDPRQFFDLLAPLIDPALGGTHDLIEVVEA